MKKMDPYTPSDFYRSLRPEYFSDSEVIREVILPKETLALELANITKNQKENEFEALCRKLVEKLIAPNLIPQVGPTGGGDGKTDADTYPVSQFIIDRWFISETEWDKNEKWAFAFSAKADWRTKLHHDINNIIETKRGYTKIYFISNQLISSRNKKELQDEIYQQKQIEVIILDGKWILENIYSNDLIDIVVDTLNLTNIYKSKRVVIGKNDADRQKILDELEVKINNPRRYFEYDFQLVEDALKSATISRMLEKPRDEVEGKFDRAERFCTKINLHRQWIRIHYQRAWTYINWYNDYSAFSNEYIRFKAYASKAENINDIELFYNLYHILIGMSSVVDLKNYNINIDTEKAELLQLISIFEANEHQACSALQAKTYRIFIEIFDSIYVHQDATPKIKELEEIILLSENMLDFPFESTKDIIELIGNIIQDDRAYDELINTVAIVSEKRNSQKEAGRIFLKRGSQKIDKEKYKDSIVYFGKAVWKLSKEETKQDMFLALLGLGYSFNELGLIWASNDCYISAVYFSLKRWFEEGKITKQAVNSIQKVVGNELRIGRVPIFLCWYELYVILYKQLNVQEDPTKLDMVSLIDACFGVRLLNTDFGLVAQQPKLPDVLNNCGLMMSRKCMLYLLGHEDIIVQESINDGFAKEENLNDVFNKWASQPFREQISYDTDFIHSDTATFNSKILGCKLIVNTNSNPNSILMAETLLAFIENFLSTSLKDVIPTTDQIIINIIDNPTSDIIRYNQLSDQNIYTIEICTPFITQETCDNVSSKLIEFTSVLFVRHFLTKKPYEYIKQLFQNEEVTERLSLIMHHANFIHHLFGAQPKYTINQWYDIPMLHEYTLKRKLSPLTITDNDISIRSTYATTNIEETGHDKRDLVSIIDMNLWDKAGWKGFGVIHHPDIGLGLLLLFSEKTYGDKIFHDWIAKYSNTDKEDIIRLSIIRGINKHHPHNYRINICANMDKITHERNHLIYSISRIHEMTPNNSENLDNIFKFYNHYKRYTLFPGYLVNGTIVPNIHLGITKHEMFIRNAWEISDNDIDVMAIKADDSPIIPMGMTDAPIINVMNKFRNR